MSYLFLAFILRVYTWYDKYDARTIGYGLVFLFSGISSLIFYKNYKILMSVRNPYDRIVSIFLNYGVTGKLGITKYNKNKLKTYVRDFFYNLTNFDYGKNDYVSSFIKKWNLHNFKPDYFIRTENLYENFNKLDFIKNSESSGFACS